VVAADPLIITSDERPVLLDAWQRLPTVWDVVRRSVDADASGGQYLLTGSAPTQGTHSGAGRIVSVRMRPLVLGERRDLSPTVSLSALLAGVDDVVTGSTPVGLTDSVGEIVAGGFPGLRHLEGRALTAQLDGYLSRIVTRDSLSPASSCAARRRSLVGCGPTRQPRRLLQRGRPSETPPPQGRPPSRPGAPRSATRTC